MHRTKFVLLSAAILAIAGCATAPGPLRPASLESYSERDNADYDADKVTTVTQWAAARGATVVWIHYPTKKSTDGR